MAENPYDEALRQASNYQSYQQVRREVGEKGKEMVEELIAQGRHELLVTYLSIDFMQSLLYSVLRHHGESPEMAASKLRELTENTLAHAEQTNQKAKDAYEEGGEHHGR